MNHNHSIDFKRMTVDDLEHLASCDFCTRQLADYVEGYELITAPRNMKEEILKSSRQFDVQLVAKSNQASKKLELFYYSLKVGFAAAFAIAFLIFTPMAGQASFKPQGPPAAQSHHQNPSVTLFERAQKITDKLNDFTYQIFQTEVTSDDK